jgi:xanthine/uracil permease
LNFGVHDVHVVELEVQLQIYFQDLLPEVASSSIVSIPTEIQTVRSRGFVGCALLWIVLQVLFRSSREQSNAKS